MPFTPGNVVEMMSADVPTATAVRRMQNAALERALLRGDHDGRYVTFAGALEHLRQAAAERGSDGLLASLVTCTALANSAELSPEMVDPWTPDVADDETRVEGAILAHRRFDIDLDRAARLAGRSTADFESVLQERDAD